MRSPSLLPVACFLLISACLQVETENPEQGTITGIPIVVDGDTLKIQSERIRLSGIDAPETKQLCRNAEGEDYFCGIVATEALESKIGETAVSCEEEGRDFYDRVLGTCYLENLDLNGWMVEQGHALAYREYSERYIQEEEFACEAQRGIWAGEFVPPWEWRRGERLESGSAITSDSCE